MHRYPFVRCVLPVSMLLSAGYVHAQSTPESSETGPLERIVVTGTRVENRSVLETAVPVDVISAVRSRTPARSK